MRCAFPLPRLRAKANSKRTVGSMSRAWAQEAEAFFFFFREPSPGVGLPRVWSKWKNHHGTPNTGKSRFVVFILFFSWPAALVFFRPCSLCNSEVQNAHPSACRGQHAKGGFCGQNQALNHCRCRCLIQDNTKPHTHTPNKTYTHPQKQNTHTHKPHTQGPLDGSATAPIFAPGRDLQKLLARLQAASLRVGLQQQDPDVVSARQLPSPGGLRILI